MDDERGLVPPDWKQPAIGAGPLAPDGVDQLDPIAELNRVIGLAAEAEQSSELTARVAAVNRREQIVQGDWRTQRLDGYEYVVDIMPKVVADRAEDKICGDDDEYNVTCRIDLTNSVHIPDQVAAAMDPDAVDEWIAVSTEQARKRGGKVALLTRGIFEAMEAQQRHNLLRALTRGAVVDGFAGPVRFGYDLQADGESGTIPLYYQVLDPRGYYEVGGNGATRGPRMVLYKRETRRGYLEREGWQLRDNQPIANLKPDERVTVYDCWEKTVTRGQVRLMHCVVVDGGDHVRGFLHEPMDMAPLGVTQIPYAFTPVRPMQYSDERYPGGNSSAFVDGFTHNWETRNKILSWQAQLVHKAVNPPTVQKTREYVELDVVTPGAVNQIAPGEDADTIGGGEALREIAQAWSMLEAMTQRGTFSAVSFGESARSLSGLQTGRLQSSSEESLTATRLAIESTLSQSYEIVAMLAKAFLRQGSYAIPLEANLAVPLNVELIPDGVTFRIRIPLMSRQEQAQIGGMWKALSDPRPNGSRFISDETARELALIPDATNEDERTRRELYHELIVDQVRQMQAKRDAERVENVEDMQAQATTELQIQAGAQTGNLGHMPGQGDSPMVTRQAPPREGQGRPTGPQGQPELTGGPRG